MILQCEVEAGVEDLSLLLMASAEAWPAQLGLGHIVWGLVFHCGLSFSILHVASPGG